MVFLGVNAEAQVLLFGVFLTLRQQRGVQLPPQDLAEEIPSTPRQRAKNSHRKDQEHRYPKWNPGKWNQRLKPAVPWWLNLTHTLRQNAEIANVHGAFASHHFEKLVFLQQGAAKIMRQRVGKHRVMIGNQSDLNHIGFFSPSLQPSHR